MAGLAPSLPRSSCGLLTRAPPPFPYHAWQLPLHNKNHGKPRCRHRPRVAASHGIRAALPLLGAAQEGVQGASLRPGHQELFQGAQSLAGYDVSAHGPLLGPALGPVSDASEAAGAVSPFLLAGGAAGAALVYGAVRTAAYFRLQYMVATVLTRYVARDASRVLDLNVASGRHLYYLPNSVQEVVAFSPSLEPKLVKAQAVSAGVEVEFPNATSGPPAPPSAEAVLLALRKMPAASFDAAVSIGGAFSLAAKGGESKQTQRLYSDLIREIARVLRPGKPLVFVERVRSASREDESPVFFMSEEDGDRFAQIVWDYTLRWVDKHVVGVAIIPLK